MGRKRTWNPQVPAFRKAAAAVLRRARKPLPISELVDRMLREEHVAPSGRTPKNSLYSIILRTNRRLVSQGKRPQFLVHRKGRRVFYTLAD